MVVPMSVITQDDFSNPLYRNDSTTGELTYSNVGPALGVDAAGWAWGCSFFDADNDGWLDLAVTNGSNTGTEFRTDPSRFWRNPGLDGGRFAEVSESVGFDDRAVASGLITFDYDGDGDLDMVQAMNDGGPLRLLQNDRGSAVAENSYLVVRPRQAGANHWAIGAKVTARIGELRMARPILAGTSTDSQEPAEAHFGLGEANVVDELVVTWPGAERETTVLTDVAANQIITVTREEPSQK
jgi:hypothetical protein